jgi:hypothetical protein
MVLVLHMQNGPVLNMALGCHRPISIHLKTTSTTMNLVSSARSARLLSNEQVRTLLRSPSLRSIVRQLDPRRLFADEYVFANLGRLTSQARPIHRTNSNRDLVALERVRQANRRATARAERSLGYTR